MGCADGPGEGAMTKRPWMPLYIGDYLGDTAHLNAMQHGAYLLLLMHYWANGSLPKDDPSLARIAHVSLKWWLRRYRAVMQQFFDDDWKHKRVELELKKADSLKSLKKKRGKVELVPLCKRKSTNDINAPISHTHSHKEKKEEDARAREKKYGGRKGKPNGLKATIKRAKQVLARDERRIAEAERRNQKGGANIVRLLSDGRGK